MNNRSGKVLPLGQPIFPEGPFQSSCILAQADSGPKFRVLEKEEELNQSLVNRTFILIDH